MSSGSFKKITYKTCLLFIYIYCESKYFSTCQTRSDDFWILNAMCMFIYLFVVYFSFAPVISAITHLYCELFYIQVLMMVIITETLTSTSHHDIFTYLDYIFPATFIFTVYVYTGFGIK